MRKARREADGKTVSRRARFQGRTHNRHVARSDVEHPLHSRGIPGRAFALHPTAQTSQHGFGIKRKVGRVHEVFSRVEWLRRAYVNDPQAVCKELDTRG